VVRSVVFSLSFREHAGLPVEFWGTGMRYTAHQKAVVEPFSKIHVSKHARRVELIDMFLV